MGNVMKTLLHGWVKRNSPKIPQKSHQEENPLRVPVIPHGTLPTLRAKCPLHSQWFYRNLVSGMLMFLNENRQMFRGGQL